ncbi:hypothetical protein [Streptomyces sp. NBC_00448]|uniref:hypothetical protein n=1 Tax=Streptomyces sp. NBC_00448 TaxID=2903652 RepID=UPI002E222A13
MRNTFRIRPGRAMAAGVLSVGLVAGGAASAVAAPSHAAKAPASTAAAASITAQASPTTVKTGAKVTFTGQAKGLKSGATVTLKREVNSKWQTVTSSGKPVQVQLKNNGPYTLSTHPSSKGTWHYRVTSGNVHSPTVNVTVN